MYRTSYIVSKIAINISIFHLGSYIRILPNSHTARYTPWPHASIGQPTILWTCEGRAHGSECMLSAVIDWHPTSEEREARLQQCNRLWHPRLPSQSITITSVVAWPAGQATADVIDWQSKLRRRGRPGYIGWVEYYSLWKVFPVYYRWPKSVDTLLYTCISRHVVVNAVVGVDGVKISSAKHRGSLPRGRRSKRRPEFAGSWAVITEVHTFTATKAG